MDDRPKESEALLPAMPPDVRKAYDLPGLGHTILGLRPT